MSLIWMLESYLFICILYLIYNFDEEMKSKGIITNSLYYNLLNIDSHFIVTLTNSGDKYDELINEIEKRFKDISFSKNELERKKKVVISNEIFSYENIEMVNEMIIDNILFDGKIETDVIGMIESLNIDELNHVLEKIDFNKKSIVILKK